MGADRQVHRYAGDDFLWLGRGQDRRGPGDDHTLFTQLVCAAGLAPCPGFTYPRSTHVQMLPLTPQVTMSNPCAGVPDNRWCPYTGPHS
jgi:hypothetical protein